MTILKLLSKKRISRALFKVCRINGFDSVAQIETYFSEHQSFDDLQWCGTQEKKELHALINSDLKKLASQWQIPTEILATPSIVRTADHILKQENLLHEHQMSIFKESLKIYEGTQPLIPSEIAKKLELYERYVRGRRRLAIKRIFQKLGALQPMKEDLLLNYNLDVAASLISIDEISARHINTRADTSFTPEFLGLLFGAYLQEQFSLLGEPEEVLAGNFLGHRHYWSRFYLVRKELTAVMDFDAFIQEVHTLVETRNSENGAIDFKRFVSYFTRNATTSQIEALVPVARKLLIKELGQHVNEDGNLVFQLKKIASVHLYLFEALDQLKVPSNPSAIRKKVNELYPEIYIDPLSFKKLMKAKWGFTNHRQAYGLKKWKQHRAGTAIIEEQSVLEEIKTKYPFNSKAYWQAHWEFQFIRLQKFAEAESRLPDKHGPEEEKKLFHFLVSQEQRIRIGKLEPWREIAFKEFRKRFPAKNRDYNDALWEENFQEFKEFVQKHLRLPRKCGPKEENRVYNWFSNNRYGISKGKLTPEKERQFSRFVNALSTKNRSHWELAWDKRFEELSLFVQTNHRLPKQEAPGEEDSLANWLRRQLRKNKQGELQPYQLLQLERLNKIEPPKPAIIHKELWEENWTSLRAFVDEQDRLPKLKPETREEKKLYSWLNIQTTRANKGLLSRGQKSRIVKIKAEYPYIKTVHHELDWDERYEVIRQFCWKHKRLPGRNNSTEEATLCHWWRNQYRRMKKGRLELRQKRMLKEIRDRYIYRKLKDI